jgi:hypothetical protein
LEAKLQEKQLATKLQDEQLAARIQLMALSERLAQSMRRIVGVMEQVVAPCADPNA